MRCVRVNDPIDSAFWSDFFGLRYRYYPRESSARKGWYRRADRFVAQYLIVRREQPREPNRLSGVRLEFCSSDPGNPGVFLMLEQLAPEKPDRRRRT